MTQEKTHWRKNLDKNYISGEDLKEELNGLKKEMNVCIVNQADGKTFDQTKQLEVTKTALHLRDLATGQMIYKPCLLNVKNSIVLNTLFGSPFIEDWYEKPFTMYAMPDKRHGHVVRFKKYMPPAVSDANAMAKLAKCETKEQLNEAWKTITVEERNLPTVQAKLAEFKAKFATNTTAQ